MDEAKFELGGLNQDEKTWLKLAYQSAQGVGEDLYLVGGLVRDTLLDRPSHDFDLLLENSAQALAECLAKKLQGELAIHPRFLTATIKLGRGQKIDIAQARKETYPNSGALPLVEPGRIEEDLERRDFSINAMAFRLGPNLAELTLFDPLGGRCDLLEGKLRILHPDSFSDDPTRVFRGLRLASRLGFDFEESTLEALKQASQGSYLARISVFRLDREFRYCLNEARAEQILQRLEEWGLLTQVHPEFTFAEAERARLNKALVLATTHPTLLSERDRWQVPLAVLMANLSPQEQARVATRFTLPPPPPNQHSTTGETRLDQIADWPGLWLLILASGLADSLEQDKILEHVQHHRDFQPLLNGSHFLNWGIPAGPEIGQWKAKAAKAQSQGAFSDLVGAKSWFLKTAPTNLLP